ncbi:type 1 glutamine amidotransferase [Streptomyces vietnamensis]|uniref:type 1 glutamine amidotransferase n=1 Tax=Streptomyces vietnamensis TaxID=362257 RepID=UPI0006990479|nr:type 1 glutamine amidotransferase [Streptomyces vietnamensis]
MTHEPRPDAPLVLVVQHESECPAGLWGTWLTETGLRLHTVHPYLDGPLPGSLAPYDGLLVLGGSPGPLEDDRHPWLPAARALLREGVERETPTFGICLGAELMAAELGGAVERRATPQVGVHDLALLPAAADDPVFSTLSAGPPAVLWHQEEMTVLPPGAVHLIGGTDAPHQAFRLGRRAWGTQFHPEATPAIVSLWSRDSAMLRRSGLGPAAIAEQLQARHADAARAWRTVAHRWAALVHDAHARRYAAGSADPVREELLVRDTD